MTKDKTKRLGYENDGDEILEHPFFADIDFEKLMGEELVAPYKPDLQEGTLDVKFFNAKTDEKDLTETFVPEAKLKKVEKYKD